MGLVLGILRGSTPSHDAVGDLQRIPGSHFSALAMHVKMCAQQNLMRKAGLVMPWSMAYEQLNGLHTDTVLVCLGPRAGGPVSQLMYK